MDLDDLSVRVVVLRMLQEKIAKAHEIAKADLAQALGPEGRKVAYADEYRLATTWVTKKRVQVDQQALLEWVKKWHPEEVETETVVTERVRAAFVTAIKNKTERVGEPCAPDGTTGIPGVTLAPGFLSVRAAEGGADAIAHLWQTGRLGRLNLDSTEVLEIEND
jgi:hypothetical protein